MHSEIVDTLRCLAVHEESWLVAAADEMNGRHIMRGLLGCPVCHARYPIDRGIADFAEGVSHAVALERDSVDTDGPAALKLAAMLDLTDAGGFVVLVGEWARLAAALREIVPVMVIAVNAPPDVAMGDGVSGVATIDRIPLAAGSERGIALDAPAIGDAGEAAIGAVKPGGRVVSTVALEPPANVAIVARDAEHWVGTRQDGAPLIRLVRARD